MCLLMGNKAFNKPGDKMDNQNLQISDTFKNLVAQRYKGVIDAYVNADGFFNVICKSKKTLLAVSADLAMAGIKTVQVIGPNKYGKNYHYAGARA
jgi:hypothetical protein